MRFVIVFVFMYTKHGTSIQRKEFKALNSMRLFMRQLLGELILE